jgi:hypothetical protein
MDWKHVIYVRGVPTFDHLSAHQQQEEQRQEMENLSETGKFILASPAI